MEKNERDFEAPRHQHASSNPIQWMILNHLKDETATRCKLRMASTCLLLDVLCFSRWKQARSCSIISSWTCCFSTWRGCTPVNASEDTNEQTAMGMQQRWATTGAAHLFLELGHTLLQFVHLVVVEPESW